MSILKTQKLYMEAKKLESVWLIGSEKPQQQHNMLAQKQLF